MKYLLLHFNVPARDHYVWKQYYVTSIVELLNGFSKNLSTMLL